LTVVRWTGAFIVGGVLAAVAAFPAQALCVYKGRLDARTTAAQEFADSLWVVRAKLIAADDYWSDKAASWTTYHLRVLETFKGVLPSNIDLFTDRDSGGFYLDKGVQHDIGGEYLLYLNATTEEVPVPARGATLVNYACGQSKAWRDVSPADRQELIASPNK
jgi:hypothetical protein